MTNQVPQLLYMLAEDLYRLGNATSPKLDNVRPRDVDIYDRNGISMVAANGRGISLITEKRLAEQPRNSGYAWKIPSNFPLPAGLGLQSDSRLLRQGQQPDHYLLCPVVDVSLDEYRGLLARLALNLERVRKI